MAWQDRQDMNAVEEVEVWRSVAAHQQLPFGLRQQVHLYCLLCQQEGSATHSCTGTERAWLTCLPVHVLVGPACQAVSTTSSLVSKYEMVVHCVMPYNAWQQSSLRLSCSVCIGAQSKQRAVVTVNAV